MAAHQTGPLPNEIWIRVLQNLDNDDDIAELWTTCRHVCTAFKEVTESIFRERHLPRTRFDFNLGKFPSPRPQNDSTLMADFEFAELSEDGRTATFRLHNDRPEQLIPETKERMQEYLDTMDIADPKHTIQIRRDVLDGPIPNLSYNKTTCELSCNWRDLFTAFYGEEALAKRLTNKWLDSKVAYLEELKAKMRRGEMGAERIISAAILEIGSGEEICRRNARRARMRHQALPNPDSRTHSPRREGEFRGLDGRTWDPDRDGDSRKERDALAKLRTLKVLASNEAFSDEEYSDEWEDEDEDEDEADESDEEESTEDEE